MANNKISGDAGELEVIGLVPCPSCSKKLMLLPVNYPLYDVQCTGCYFRAQVKTNLSKPKKEIFGAGWEITNKVLKSGFQMPPLIANFKWVEKAENHQEIRFYPFIPKNNLKKRNVVFSSDRKDHMMFNYIGLDELPYFVLFRK
jgi:hypothetical protein